MNRILLALVLSSCCSVACAGIPALNDNNHINCPKSGNLDAKVAKPAPAPAPVATRSGGGAPAEHGGTAMPARGSAPRVISPRWHSFLPGMFR